jgi:hypothetical protein
VLIRNITRIGIGQRGLRKKLADVRYISACNFMSRIVWLDCLSAWFSCSLVLLLLAARKASIVLNETLADMGTAIDLSDSHRLMGP